MQGIDEIFPIQITLLDNLKSILPEVNRPSFVLLFKVRTQELQKVLEVRLTNCMDIFFEGTIDKEQLLDCKQEMNFEGSWASYFKLIKTSLMRENKGKVEVIGLEDFLLSLKITYPIEDCTQILLIKGTGKFDSPERAKRIQAMFFEVVGSYEEEKKTLESKIEEISRDPIKRVLPSDFASHYEYKKKKYKGNLINPSVKKRKQPMGARICVEE